MKIVRFEFNHIVRYGILEGNIIRELKYGPFEDGFLMHSPILKKNTFQVKKTKLLAPCQPSKYLGVALNFAGTVKKLGIPIPDKPIPFIKPSTSIVGPKADIIFPKGEVEIVFEGELALVIGKEAKNVQEGYAMDYIIGCTCTNDVSDISKFELDKGNPVRIKAADTFGPIGPCIETDLCPDDATIRTWVNGELRQEGNTKDLIFGIDFLVSYFSSFMTLLPGDIIATGTPPGSSPIKSGDLVEVEVDGVGKLENRMRSDI